MRTRAGDGKRHIVAFSFITGLCRLGDSMLYIVLPVHFAEMGLSSLWEVGVILAVNRLVRLPLNPCIGWFYRHVSERAGILIAAVLATLTTFSYGFLPGLAFWILARCLWGLAWTLLRLGSLFCLLRLSTPENRGYYTGLYNGLSRLGSLAGVLLGGIIADAAGPGTTAVIFGSATAPAVALALFFIPSGGEEKQQEASGAGLSLAATLAATLRDWKVFWLVAAGGLVAFVFQGSVNSTLSRLIDVHTGGEVILFGAMLGASTLGGFFQALRWGGEPWLAPLAGKFSDSGERRPRMMFASFGAGTVLFVLLGLYLPLPLWFICVLGMQFVSILLNTVSDAAATSAAAEGGGRSLLMAYALVVDVGAAIGPLAAYTVNGFFGIDAVYLMNAAVCAALFCRWWPYAAGRR